MTAEMTTGCICEKLNLMKNNPKPTPTSANPNLSYAHATSAPSLPHPTRPNTALHARQTHNTALTLALTLISMTHHLPLSFASGFIPVEELLGR